MFLLFNVTLGMSHDQLSFPITETQNLRLKDVTKNSCPQKSIQLWIFKLSKNGYYFQGLFRPGRVKLKGERGLLKGVSLSLSEIICF
jgi:hypothetical protein